LHDGGGVEAHGLHLTGGFEPFLGAALLDALLDALGAALFDTLGAALLDAFGVESWELFS